MNDDLRQIKTEDMLRAFKTSAAKKQAQFFWVTRGTSPRVTKESVEEEAQRLLAEWKGRKRKALPADSSPEGVLPITLNEPPKKTGTFECRRCYKTFATQSRFL